MMNCNIEKDKILDLSRKEKIDIYNSTKENTKIVNSNLENNINNNSNYSNNKNLFSKLFNRNNFVKNLKQFKEEIMKIVKKLFCRKKLDEILEIIEEKGNELETENEMLGRRKKHEHFKNIFLKNELMSNDLKKNNDKKKSKDIECTIEFLIYCENFNKKENSYQTFIEPICTEIIIMKKELNTPIHIYYYFSWININWNFNFLDNILSLCCSIIFSMITQRTRLLLGRHMNDIDKRKNRKKIIQGHTKNEKMEDGSLKNPHVNTNTTHPTEYDDNNTERKNLSEIDDTQTSMYLPNYYGALNDEQYKD